MHAKPLLLSLCLKTFNLSNNMWVHDQQLISSKFTHTAKLFSSHSVCQHRYSLACIGMMFAYKTKDRPVLLKYCVASIVAQSIVYTVLVQASLCLARPDSL